MNKIKLLFVLVSFLSCIIFIGNMAAASDDRRRSEIQSRGIINYANGKVIIDTSDLTSLADQTDEVEISYKVALTDSLAQIGTYVRVDGSIEHSNAEEIDSQQIRYSDLTAGIIQSQSVDYLADTQAADTKGDIYYMREVNNILEVTNDDTGMPVFVSPATEDNLTADTAAWIDGKCIVGTGADNYYFYQKGYIEGYAAKVGATVEYIYDDTGRVSSAKLIFP